MAYVLIGIFVILVIAAFNTQVLTNNSKATKQSISNSQKIIQNVNKDLEKVNNRIKEANNNP